MKHRLVGIFKTSKKEKQIQITIFIDSKKDSNDSQGDISAFSPQTF